ncbi:unnamed protein product [Parnassius apollo]|uniref:(apollo) hypothetical protein n=1 Tax=Parnassius apollo TaxID=110799 RepID=A0A8S3X5H7_PARAO|nr:unnamed protein product [Parnassius apollo]
MFGDSGPIGLEFTSPAVTHLQSAINTNANDNGDTTIPLCNDSESEQINKLLISAAKDMINEATIPFPQKGVRALQNKHISDNNKQAISLIPSERKFDSGVRSNGTEKERADVQKLTSLTFDNSASPKASNNDNNLSNRAVVESSGPYKDFTAISCDKQKSLADVVKQSGPWKKNEPKEEI